MLVNEGQNNGAKIKGFSGSYGGIQTNGVQSKTQKILGINKNKNTAEFIKFRETINCYYGEIISIAQNKCSDDFSLWHNDHIVILQNIYKKLFPDYEKYTAWHCLIGATPDYEKLEFCDFPGQYNLMNFLIKFKLELNDSNKL